MSNDGQPRAFAELRDVGLLWLINRVVLHPRGYALGLTIDAATGEALGWWLFGDGTEPWNYPEGDEPEQFAAVEALLSRPSGES